MTRFIAFLRAINVGGHVVKMDHLRGLFRSQRFSRVETFIASGNVIFETKSGNVASLEQKIERRLLDSLGYEVATFLRTDSEVFHVHGREVYWLCRKKQSESTFSNAPFERALKVRATFRGLKTVARLAAKLGDNAAGPG